MGSQCGLRAHHSSLWEVSCKCSREDTAYLHSQMHHSQKLLQYQLNKKLRMAHLGLPLFAMKAETIPRKVAPTADLTVLTFGSLKEKGWFHLRAVREDLLQVSLLGLQATTFRSTQHPPSMHLVPQSCCLLGLP